MNDRDLIAMLIHDNLPAIHISDVIPRTEYMFPPDTLAAADAVLAAIGDRLMPDLPEWVQLVGVTLMHDRVSRSNDPDWRQQYGTGPTIPAAIANALESDR